MELTPDQQQRILEEERARFAEERYRAQVRKDLSGQSESHERDHKGDSGTRIVLFLSGVLVLVIIAVGLLRGRQVSNQPSAETTQSGVSLDQPKSLKQPEQIPIPQELSTGRIAELATRSVVVVENFNAEGQKAGHGSGYLYSSDGIVITNYHVIRGANSLTIRMPTSETKQVVSVLGFDSEKDVAALKISLSSMPPLETDDSETNRVGDRVVAIGAPLGLESTVSEGIISAIRGPHLLQTTASISPGSSGGPLLNRYGKVIGLTTATIQNGQSLNFVVSSKYVTELLSRKEEISLAQMLDRTRTEEPLAVNTFMVGARSRMPVPFQVRDQQGAWLEGMYSISGGSGNDIAVSLVDLQQQRIILNSGRVSGSGQIKIRLPKGNYALFFDNSYSMFSSKSVSPALSLHSFK